MPRPTLRRSPRDLPFRWKFVLVSLLVVLVTVLLMVVPLYLNGQEQVARAYQERLTAMAYGASIAIPADAVDSLLAAPPGKLTVHSVVAHNALRDFAQRAATDSAAGDGVRLILLGRDAASRVLAHSGSSGATPEAAERWIAPPGLSDSLQNVVAGRRSVFWFDAGHRLIAAAPVLQSTTPVGLVVAEVDARAAVAALRQQLLSVAWYPVLAVAVAIALGTIVSRGLSERVEALAAQAQVIARGDLRQPLVYAGRDELGSLADSLREMAGRLRTILTDVQSGARDVSASVETLMASAAQVHAASEEVAQASQSIAAGAQEQSAGVEAIVRTSSDAA
ncbi:MAG: HAMP domain-containing protein, partial [Gemmatimonadaceae bacterium]